MLAHFLQAELRALHDTEEDNTKAANNIGDEEVDEGRTGRDALGESDGSARRTTAENDSSSEVAVGTA